MRDSWERPLWLSRIIGKNHTEVMDKLEAIENIFGTAGDATAEAGDIIKGKTAYNGNVLVTGSLEDYSDTGEHYGEAVNDIENSRIKLKVLNEGKYGVGNYFYAAYASIASLIGLTAQKLTKGSTVLGVTGDSNNMDTSDGDAVAAEILSGKKAAVKGTLITGTMKNRRGTTVTAGAVTQDDTYTYLSIPEEGCYSAASKVRALNSDIKQVYYVGCGTSFNIKDKVPGWNKLTSANILTGGVVYVGVGTNVGQPTRRELTINVAYNATTGQITISNTGAQCNDAANPSAWGQGSVNPKVWVVVGKVTNV